MTDRNISLSPSTRFGRLQSRYHLSGGKARARKNRNGCPRQFSSSLPTRKQSESVFWWPRQSQALMYDSAEQLYATENLGGRCLRRLRRTQQIKHERRVCHFPLQAGRGVGLRRRGCRPRAGTVYQRGRQHSGCADRTYSGGRKRIQNHLLGKTLSRLHRPIRLDSSRIRRQLVSLARAENGRMVVSSPPQIFRMPSQRNLRAGVPLKAREIRRCAQ